MLNTSQIHHSELPLNVLNILSLMVRIPSTSRSRCLKKDIKMIKQKTYDTQEGHLCHSHDMKLQSRLFRRALFENVVNAKKNAISAFENDLSV